MSKTVSFRDNPKENFLLQSFTGKNVPATFSRWLKTLPAKSSRHTQVSGSLYQNGCSNKGSYVGHHSGG